MVKISKPTSKSTGYGIMYTTYTASKTKIKPIIQECNI